jgi:hypothetical protein
MLETTRLHLTRTKLLTFRRRVQALGQYLSWFHLSTAGSPRMPVTTHPIVFGIPSRESPLVAG